MKIISRHRLVSLCVIALCAVQMRTGLLSGIPPGASDKTQGAVQAAALRRNGVPFSLHIYPKGAHGLGLGGAQWDPGNRHPWTMECAAWLKEQGFGNGPVQGIR